MLEEDPLLEEDHGVLHVLIDDGGDLHVPSNKAKTATSRLFTSSGLDASRIVKLVKSRNGASTLATEQPRKVVHPRGRPPASSGRTSLARHDGASRVPQSLEENFR
jgi:hypothetical protein